MFQQFLKFMLSLILRGLKTKQMTNSIDDLILNRVLSKINTKSTINVVDSGKLQKIIYEAVLNGESLVFSIEYSNNSIHVYFEETTIKHMSTLNEYFEKILLQISIYETELCGHFQIRIQSV